MTGHRAWAEVPEGWVREARSGPWPFVTAERFRGPDGTIDRWTSRADRKRSAEPGGSTWWAPMSGGWWIGVLFAIGSACFALGSFPPYAVAVGGTADSRTYFVGSLFFTTAAFLQYAEAGRASRFPDAGEHRRRGTTWRVLTWEPWRIDWWATAVQFAGTLLFNVSTFAAVRGATMTVSHQNHRIWMPDVLGSVCFLVASLLAWGEAGHRWWSWRPGSIGWQIAALNLAGSIAFGLSAVGAYVVPSDGELLSVALANLGTFVGALCFLAGGVLLLPERTRGPATADD